MPDDQTSPNGASLTEFGLVCADLARSLVHTMMPGTVIRYHKPTGVGDERTPAMVDVRPDFLYRRKIENPGDVMEGERAIERSDGWHAQGSYPDLVSVPVAYSGPDGMRSSGPIDEGAHGWLFFAQRSIDGCINKGGPIDPAFDYQWHHLSDAIFVPGARYGAVAEDIDPNVDRVGSADGGAGMEITRGPKDTREVTVSTEGPTVTLDAATSVKLGATATLGVARLTDPVNADTSMAAWIAAVQAALTTIAGVVPGVVLPTPPTDFGVISGASSKVSAE